MINEQKIEKLWDEGSVLVRLVPDNHEMEVMNKGTFIELLKSIVATNEEGIRSQAITDCKNELLKHLFLMTHENNYPSEAVPKATILELESLMRSKFSGTNKAIERSSIYGTPSVCTKCNGEGYCSSLGNSTSVNRVCPVCNGAKVIFPVLLSAPIDEKWISVETKPELKVKTNKSGGATKQVSVNIWATDEDGDVWQDTYSEDLGFHPSITHWQHITKPQPPTKQEGEKG